MYVFFNIDKNELWVAEDDNTPKCSLREFYMSVRKNSNYTTHQIAKLAGLSHARLWWVEHPNKQSGKYSNSPAVILAALEILGFNLTLKKQG